MLNEKNLKLKSEFTRPVDIISSVLDYIRMQFDVLPTIKKPETFENTLVDFVFGGFQHDK